MSQIPVLETLVVKGLKFEEIRLDFLLHVNLEAQEVQEYLSLLKELNPKKLIFPA